MKKALLNFFERIEPNKEKSPFLHTAYDAFFTFAFAPNTVTKGGVHIRDGMDLKRTMVHVVLALQLCYLFGTYNIGAQHYDALGMYPGFFEGFHLKLVHGLIKIIPIFLVTHIVGLGIEFFYAAKKGHAVEEGFLVSGALIPLIMPPDLPLWMLGVSVAFAVIIGKEAFGGTGMNIWNIALLSRVFVFFAYPTYISGDEVWISDIVKGAGEGGAELASGYASAGYGWAHGAFDWIFSAFGWSTFGDGGIPVIDGYTGATPLALAAKGGWESATEIYTVSQMWWGDIPGSIGEMSKPLIIVGALFLIFTKVADWRIMVSMVLGAAAMGMIMNGMVDPRTFTEDTAGVFRFMAVPWYYQFYMGSFLFAMAFMATDPVTAATTNRGKWIYGALIGAIGLIVRVWNPAYPEGWMLAILFMNTFSALIDSLVLRGNMNRRMKRATVTT